jgi:hypothetical protein
VNTKTKNRVEEGLKSKQLFFGKKDTSHGPRFMKDLYAINPLRKSARIFSDEWVGKHAKI